MYIAKSCPCCGSESHKTFRSIAAPFIVNYVLGGRDIKVNLLDCDVCHFRWFDQRFEPTDMARLYEGYRGAEYAKIRHNYEPWYSKDVNDAIGGSEEIRDRAETMTGFLRGGADVSDVDAVLDYGGDRGQFIPPGLGRRHYVYEVSGVDAVQGVGVVGSEKELIPGGYDLVMLCHVLEHLPDPSGQLELIRPLLSRDKGLLYVEVPHERYDMRFVGSGGVYGGYLAALKKVPFALRAADFYSTGFRVKLGKVPPLGFLKMHEHINFFSIDSLTAALERSGYEVLKIAILKANGPSGLNQVLHALARPKPN